MASETAAAADAVTAIINAAVQDQTIPQQFTAIRQYVPEFLLDGSEPIGLICFVAPAGHKKGQVTRGTQLGDFSVIVNLIKKVDDLANESIDPLLEVMEIIQGLLDGSVTVNGQDYLGTIEKAPLYKAEYLIEQRLFWGPLIVDLSFPE